MVDQGVVCELCGKHFKSRAGLAGHRSLSACGISGETARSGASEVALSEIIESLSDAFSRLEKKLDGFATQIAQLKAQLTTVGERVGEAKLNDAERAEIEVVKARLEDAEAKIANYQTNMMNLTYEQWAELGEAHGYLHQLSDAEEAKLAEKEKSEVAEPLPEVLASEPDPAVAGKYELDPHWNLWRLKSDKLSR